MLAGPLYGEEGMVTADCDLRICLHTKRSFDAVGHYSREDVLARLIADPDGDGARPAQRASAAKPRSES